MSDNPYKSALALMQRDSPDIKAAYEFLTQAMKEGMAEAEYAIATWYLHGKEPAVKKNLTMAVKLLRMSAEKGVAEANFDLAVCYEMGVGVKKSLKTAYKYYLTAALLGDEESSEEIARMHYYGLGVEKDRSIASVWMNTRRGDRVNI